MRCCENICFLYQIFSANNDGDEARAWLVFYGVKVDNWMFGRGLNVDINCCKLTLRIIRCNDSLVFCPVGPSPKRNPSPATTTIRRYPINTDEADLISARPAIFGFIIFGC